MVTYSSSSLLLSATICGPLTFFFFFLIVCHNLRTSYLVLQAQTFLDFDVHTIAQSGGYLLTVVGLLLAAALYDINKGAVAAELDGTLRNGENLQSLG